MDESTCDECGPAVRAYVWIDLPSGGELAYCGHHYAVHQDALRVAHATVVDLRYLILEGG